MSSPPSSLGEPASERTQRAASIAFDTLPRFAPPDEHPTHANDNLPAIMVIYTEYPECMEAILDACTQRTLLALRAANSDMREVVDGHLGRKHHVYFYHRLLTIMKLVD